MNAWRARSWFAFGTVATVMAIGAVAPAADGPEKVCACCEAKGGGFSGIWSGEYRYGEGSGQRPVAFTAFLFQDGDRIQAMIKEANTFGDDRSPWLHATAEGRYDASNHTLRFTKTYDGTGGQNHDVAYEATAESTASRTLEGTWDLGGARGTFLMKRKPTGD